MQIWQKAMPGVRRTLDSSVGPPIVLKMTAPRLANSCHLPKVKALTPKRLPAGDVEHNDDFEVNRWCRVRDSSGYICKAIQK